MFPISRYKGFVILPWMCTPCDNSDFTEENLIWKVTNGTERASPLGLGAVLVLIGNGHRCYHSARGQQPLWKESVLHTHSPGNRESKAYVDPHQACMDPTPAFACSLGSNELHAGDSVYPVFDLFWWWVEHINTPLWKPASVPSLCFFWSYTRRYQHSFIPSLAHSFNMRIYYMQGIGFMLWRKF